MFHPGGREGSRAALAREPSSLLPLGMTAQKASRPGRRTNPCHPERSEGSRTRPAEWHRIRLRFEASPKSALRFRGGNVKARTILGPLVCFFTGLALYAADPNMGTWKLNET